MRILPCEPCIITKLSPHIEYTGITHWIDKPMTLPGNVVYTSMTTETGYLYFELFQCLKIIGQMSS